VKAVFINEFGEIDKLIYSEDFPKPEPQEGEVLVKIKAAGVNPVDIKIRQGIRKFLPYNFPSILGWDMAGIIEDRGFSSRRFNVGDEVYAYARRPIVEKGTYAEYIALPESYITRKPKNLSFEEAASVPLAGLTAFQALYTKANIKQNEWVLILGASGGVGTMAVQLAKIAGAKVAALASKSNHHYLTSLGADICLDYNDYSWGSALQKEIKGKADACFDCVGGESYLKAYELVKQGGNLVSIANRENPELIQKWNVNFQYHFVEPNVQDLDIITTYIEEGKLKIVINTIYPLRDVVKAHEKMETGHTQGKIVLSI
jgi:NADPH:quinone reductase-like Zn-dependent oxidoreductase